MGPWGLKRSAAAFAAMLALALSIAARSSDATSTTASSGAASITCTAYASPFGSDTTGTGSLSTPFSSLTKLDASLAPGQTGCLETGTYGSVATRMDLDTNGTASARITITAAPGATPHVTGFIEMNGTYTTVSNLSIDGSNIFYDYATSFNPCKVTGFGSQALQVNGQGDIFQNNDYYQSVATLRQNGIGIGFNGNSSPGANGNNVVIRFNRIHDVGSCLAFDHTIYLESGSGAQIYDNWVYNDTNGFGVQVYPSPSNAHIFSNIIYNVGSGFAVGGASTVRRNIVNNNVVASATGLPTAGSLGRCIQSYWPGPSGAGNQAIHNDCFADPGGIGTAPAVKVSGNILTDPQFLGTATENFQVAPTSPVATWGLATLANIGPLLTSPAPGPTPTTPSPGSPGPVPGTPSAVPATPATPASLTAKGANGTSSAQRG